MLKKTHEIVEDLKLIKEMSYPGAFDEALLEIEDGSRVHVPNDFRDQLKLLEALLDSLSSAPRSIKRQVESLIFDSVEIQATEFEVNF